MRLSLPRTLRQCTCAVICASALSGCISYTSETGNVRQSIPDSGTLNEVQLGQTTTAWLLEQFGQPQAVRRPSETSAVWQYENVARSERSIRALPLLAIEMSAEEVTAFNFEIENEYIVRYWTSTPTER